MVARMGKVELKIEIDAELLRRAQDAGLDPSEVLESELQQRLAREGVRDRGRDWTAEPGRPDTSDARAAKWAEENAEAISDHRRSIEENGVFGEDLRRW